MFVTLEGPEGAGKSSVASGLEAALRADGHFVLLTREPGSGHLGMKIRSLLLESENVAAKSEVFLFLADRASHVEELVRPALEQGQVVLCDRYIDSTIVYQGHARGFELSRLREWNTFATDGLLPDLTLLLDVPVVVGLGRLQSKDRLDLEPVEFHERVRSGFLSEAARDPERWVVINADRPLEMVLADCLDVARKRLAVLQRPTRDMSSADSRSN